MRILLIGMFWRTGMEKHLGDYSFSNLSTRGEEGSLAEQAAQSAAASTFEVSPARFAFQPIVIPFNPVRIKAACACQKNSGAGGAGEACLMMHFLLC